MERKDDAWRNVEGLKSDGRQQTEVERLGVI